MIKNYFLYILIFFLFPTFILDAQNSHENIFKFRVIYQYNQQALKANKIFTITDTMALDIDESYSVYYDRNLAANDSLTNLAFLKIKTFDFSTNQEALEQRLEIKGKADEITGDRKGETTRLFKDRLKNEIITTDRDPKDLKYKFIVFEEITPKWNISQDTAIILNYSCMKATSHFRGRDYIAWFTTEIPINDGPWKFFGLPGLILQIDDTENIFKIKAIGLEKIAQMRYQKPDNTSNYEKMTNSEFNKYKQNQFKKISYGFYKNQTSMQYFYNMKNPVTYLNIEVGD